MRSVKGYADVMKVLGETAGMTEEELKDAYDNGNLTEGMDEQTLIHNMLQMMKDKHVKLVKDSLPPGQKVSDEEVMRSAECALIHLLLEWFSGLGYEDKPIVEVIWYAMRKLD